MDAIRITDDTPQDVAIAAIEARTRRLMAERARLPSGWEHRADRRRLLALIEDTLDEWLGTQR